VPPVPAEPEVEALPDVVVTDPLRQPVTSASPLGPTPALETAQPVGTLAGESLRYRTEGTLGATLGREPGVSSSGFGPGAARPVIRGQGGERIRILENGTGSLDVSGLSDDHAVAVDPTSVARLEVLRGPATLRYGANAIGGVVYVHDGRVPDTAIGRRLTGRVGGAVGAADEERSGFASLAGQSGSWNWRVSGFARETDDVDIPGFAKSKRLLEEEGNPSGTGEAKDVLPNSYAKAWGGSVGASYVVPRGFAGAALSSFRTDYGVPNEPEVHIELDRVRLDARGAWSAPLPGIARVTWDAAYADYEHTEFEGSEVGTVFDQRAFEGRVEVAHCPYRCWEGAFGVQGSHTDLEVTGEEALLPHARTTVAALFFEEHLALARGWTLQFGARYDHTRIDSAGEESFDAGSASVGLLWRPSARTTWALSGAYASRAPTAVELYADGPHVATETFEVGDPDLGLERSVGFDLSYRTDARLVSASVTGYWHRYLEYIALLPTGAVDVDSGLDIFEYVGHRAELYGVEGRAAVHVWRRQDRGVDVEVLGDWVHAQDLDADAPLPRTPPLRLGAGLVYRDPRWTARLDVQHAFEQDRAAEFELDTDAYTLLGAGLSYTWNWGCGRRVTASLAGTNLLDEEVRLHTSFTKDLAPERGRSVRLAVEVEF
jgi:iron complex outermembrane receptor protein